MVELKPDARLLVIEMNPGIIAVACGSSQQVDARRLTPAPAVKAEFVHHPCQGLLTFGYQCCFKVRDQSWIGFRQQRHFRVLLDPLGLDGDRRIHRAFYDKAADIAVSPPVTTAAIDAVLLFDGVFERDRPAEHADIVVYNDDPGRPAWEPQAL